MSVNRIYDLARKLDVPSRELIDFLKTRGIEVKSHMSSVDASTADLIVNHIGKRGKAGAEKSSASAAPEKKVGSRAYIPPRRRNKRRHEVLKTPAVERQREADVRVSAPAGKTEKDISVKDAAAATAPQAETVQEKKPFAADRPARTASAGAKSRGGNKSPAAERKQETRPRRRAGTQAAARPDGQKSARPDSQRAGRTSQGRKPAQGKKPAQARGQGARENGREGFVKRKPGEQTGQTTGARKDSRQHVYRSDGGAQADKKKTEEKSRRGKGTVHKRPPQVTAAEAKDGRTPAKKKEHPRNVGPGGGAFQRSRPRPRPGGRRVKKKQVKTAVSQASQAVEQAIIEQEQSKVLQIPEVIMVKDLASKMHMSPAKIIQHLMTMGFMPNVNQVLEPEAAKSIAEHFEFEVKTVSVEEEAVLKEEVIDESLLKPRSPVVTIMGHVDHGKTTLLDAIRESKVTESEFGGITQHIGAYSVEVHGQKIVFLDTPGHEAFTAMRARGAKATDEVILVVAADDGIMPQTIEAIDHARDADVPIIVAINKIDTPGSNPDRVMQELTKYDLTPEDWGGETICVKVSAKEKTNLDGLLEMILLQSEMLELKADPDRLAKGVIVEALLDKGRGPVATVLVQSGTLRVGDPFVVGQFYGKVRAMLDDHGKKVKEAGPASPVEVLGLSGVPTAGDFFTVVKSEREARQVSESRQDQQQKLEFSRNAKITLEGLHQHIKDGETQELRIVIKADVHGSIEALKDSLERLSTEQVRLQVIHGGVGAINESDVMLASASNAVVIGFNVRPVAKAQEMAEKEQIDVRLYTVIYQAIDDVKKAMEGLLKPRFNELLTGQAQVQAVFSLPKGGRVAGCRVTDGKIQRSSLVRLLRGKEEVFKGNLASLRRVKDDVKEVLTGYECGIRLENYNDVKEGDVIEAYTLEKVVMTLEEAAAHHR
ncbi:MAG: translation initiation factor IF-2 [bacterium]|nr:translation initiation factor IF-2 [bacterium]